MGNFINDVKLTQECRVLLENISWKLPSPLLKNNNVPVPTQTSRRQSIRLLRKARPHMKVTALPVRKKQRNIGKKISQVKLTDPAKSNIPNKASEKKLTDAKQPNDKSFDTTNCYDQLTAELGLSNVDINSLIAEIESFIENAEFVDELVSSLDTTDFNLNFIPFAPVLTTPIDFIPSMASVSEISNEMFCLEEIGDLPLDLSLPKVKSTGPKSKPKVISDKPLDLSIRKVIN